MPAVLKRAWGSVPDAGPLVAADRASLNAQSSRLGRLGRLGRSPGSPGTLAQAAWDAEVARKDRPIGSEAAFSTVLGGSGSRFSLFSEVTSRERVDSQREEPNLGFCWQAQYFRGFAVFLRKSEVDGNR